MRSLADFFLDRPKLVWMILTFLTLVGISSLLFLPKEATPDISVPIAFVQVVYPGVSPEDIEQEITNKIEDALAELDDVDSIRSFVAEGITWIVVEFIAGADIDEKVRDTRDEVDSIRNELPDDIQEPVVTDWSFSNIPILVLSISSDSSQRQLRRLAEDVKSDLAKVSGVSKVSIVGALDEEVHVNIDPDKLLRYNLSLSDIIQTIGMENANIPVGTNKVGTNTFVVRSMGRFESLEEMGDVVLSSDGGKIVTLSDVAEIKFETEERDSYARLNGKDCVNILVQKKSGENLIKTVESIKAEMTRLEPTFPPGTEYVYTGDQSWSVRISNTNLNQNLGWGLLLVFLILLFFLGFRSSLIITPSIPWSLFCGYIFLWISGDSISNVVTFGAIIVLGMLVDDAIIVTENAMRHLEMGKSKFDAARDSIHEVGGAILAAGLTTFAAFGPMLFMPGITGQFIKYIPIIVISSLGGAILIAHAFTPVFCRYFLRREHEESRMNQVFGGWLQSVLPPYEKILRKTLRHPFLTASIAWLLFFIAIGIVGSGSVGFELFPDAPLHKFIIDINAPLGTNIEETDRIVKQVEERIADIPEMDFYATSIGEGAADSNINRYSGGSGESFGTIFGDLLELPGGRHPNIIIDEMRGKIKGITGARIEFVAITQGPPEGYDVEIRVAGPDYAELEKISGDVQNVLAGIDGLIDIKDDYDPAFPEVQIMIDRERAALNGLSNSMIGATIRTAFDGLKASTFYSEGEEYDVIVQFPPEERSRIDDLRRVNLRNIKGQLIPFSQIADLEYTSGVANIRHRDGQRTITITAELDPLVKTNAVEVQKQYLPTLRNLTLQPEYEFIFGGQNEELANEFLQLGRAMIIGLLLIFVILSITFNSYYQPLTVLGAIPFACIGVIVGLLVTGNKFGFMPGVGIVALSGIVINDAIVLIDYLNQIRARENLELVDALVKACKDRLRPVLMTSFTTIVGIVPLAIGIGGGSEFWGSLGWSMMFGLLFSTVLILLIIPAFFKINEWLFSPAVFWSTDSALMKLVRVVLYLLFVIGMAMMIGASVYFVVFMR